MPINPTENTFRFRHFAPEIDLPRLLHLLMEVESTDQTGEDISEETLRDQMTWPGHDPILDRWVVEMPDDQNRLIAFSSIWKAPTAQRADIYVAVHPGWRRQGIGSNLLQRALARVQEKGAHSALAYANTSHIAANNFLSRHGFAEVAKYTEMLLPADVTVPLPVWLDGYYVRSYDTIGHIPTLLSAINSSYQGLWGHREVTEEELLQWIPDTRHAGTFLLFAPDGGSIGICQAEISEHLSARRGKRTGYIDSPGVVSEYRDRDLYLPLLLTAIQWIRAQEVVAIELASWGDSERNLAQYQQIGFKVQRQELIYQWVSH